MTLLSFFLFFPFFLVAIFFSFFLPGYVVIKHIKLTSPLAAITLATVTGLVMWGFQGYIFGYSHVRWATYLYILIIIFLAFKSKLNVRKVFRDSFYELKNFDKKILLLLFLGVGIQLLPVFGSGLLYVDGVRFFGINATDGVMHLGYIQSITHFFPPIEPGAYKQQIQNYHYWSDMVISEIARVWFLPIPHLFFRYFPLIISLLTGISVYFVVLQWGGKKIAGMWGIFFAYFAGDAPFLFTLIPYTSFGFNTPAIDNGALQFFNMPQAMARLIFITALIPFTLWITKHNKTSGIIAILLFSSLIGFKVYFGIFVLCGLVFMLVVDVLWNKTKITNPFISVRKRVFETFLLLALCVVSASIYLPPNKSSGGLIFDPLEWPYLLLGFAGINLKAWWQLLHFTQRNHLLFLYPILDIIAVCISLVIIYGTRALGFFSAQIIWKKNLKLFFFLFPALLLFQLLGLFTAQSSGGLNVFNFFAVSAVILTLLTPFALEKLGRSYREKLLIVIIILITIPRVIYETGASLNSYLTQKDSYLVTNQELQVLTFLKNNTPHDAIVQSSLHNHWDMRTPYVAFFSDRYSLFSGVGLQETHNTSSVNRQRILADIFSAPNSADFANKLKQNGILYAYIRKKSEEQLPYKLAEGHYHFVFENNEVIVVSPK